MSDFSRRTGSRGAMGAGPDLLGLYLDEAGSFPLLTKADEMRLGQVIQACPGCSRAAGDCYRPDASRRRATFARPSPLAMTPRLSSSTPTSAWSSPWPASTSGRACPCRT